MQKHVIQKKAFGWLELPFCPIFKSGFIPDARKEQIIYDLKNVSLKKNIIFFQIYQCLYNDMYLNINIAVSNKVHHSLFASFLKTVEKNNKSIFINIFLAIEEMFAEFGKIS